MSDDDIDDEREERDAAGRDLVKVSILAKRSGVPAATIKHYVREGLLPEPSRTSRNMAYYDVALVPRIQKIKDLQRTRFLPLKVIKQILDESEFDREDDTVAAVIARVVEQSSAPSGPSGQREQRTREEILKAGVLPTQLEWLESAQLIVAVPGSKPKAYAGDDLEILRVLGAARRAGLTPEMLPVTILGEYGQALSALVRAELRLFREGVMPKAGAELPALTEAATTLSERLVVLLRRKMLVPTLHALADEQKRASKPPPAPTPSRATRRKPVRKR
ncbi:MAG: MerR family transcriptional regulator [Myxococcota bacterium]|nr:MerR family transcriptional regulator [Myxococcota bacterium]